MTDEVLTHRPRIVLGLDGSAGSTAALEWCLRYASSLDAEVVAVFVLNPLISVIPAPVLPEQSPMWEEQAIERMADELNEWCRPLRDAGVPSPPCVALGTPFVVLAYVAHDEDAAMIVVGRSGRGGITEMLLGSVPHTLTHHAVRPVLVVPVR
jgi:nucleotide-binding universal stress UspA family protein